MSSESISWPPEFADFKKFDTTLKCGICYEYMTNSMMTLCAHNFCSICIRKFLVYKNTCPTCFMTVLEKDLRNNRPVDDIILVYAKLRDKLIRTLRIASVPIPQSEPLTPKFEKTESPVSAKKTSEPSKKVAVQLFKKEHKVDDDVVVNGIKIPGIFNSTRSFPKPKKPGEFTECPVCKVEVPTKNINLHLDSCLAIDNGAKPKKPKEPKEKLEPLPKRLYYLMSDKTLKDFMKGYGLSIQGDRKSLLFRVQRFTVIYNSECDSLNPKSVAEIVQQVEREEREERKPNALMKSFTSSRIVVSRNDSPEKIEKAHKMYREENKDSFKKLIEAMKEREGRNIKPLKPPSRVYSDDDHSDTESNLKNFDPDKPSTSKIASSPLYSVFSQATVVSDSDSDIFENRSKNSPKTSPKRKFVPKITPESSPKKIDWRKTCVMENSQKVSEDVLENDFSEGSQNDVAKVDDLFEDSEGVNFQDDSSNLASSSEESYSLNQDVQTPRMTRSRAKKQSDEINENVTPKGSKRKFSKSPKLSMEKVFDDCFENYNGNKLGAEVEDDASLIQDMLDRSDWKTPRRTTRRKVQSERKAVDQMRKKLKRGRSPAF